MTKEAEINQGTGEPKRISLKKVQRRDVVEVVGLMISFTGFFGYYEWNSNVWLLIYVLSLANMIALLCLKMINDCGFFDMFSRISKKYHVIKWIEIVLLVVVSISLWNDCCNILSRGIG